MSLLIFCRCRFAGVYPPEVRQSVSAALAQRGDAVAVDDLCACAANRDPRLAAWAGEARLTVAACHPRAVAALFRWAGSALDPARATFLNLRKLRGPELAAALGGGASADVPAEPAGTPADGWLPWFPVIDETRCRQCRQCLSFCLFGVYSLSPEGRVVVTQPRQCKTNCPACARICPEAAILFPKLPEADAPLNGDEVTDETLARARARIDAAAILGDDPAAALARRRVEAARRRLKRPPEP